MKYRIFSKMNKGGDVYYFPEYKNIFGFWCRFKELGYCNVKNDLTIEDYVKHMII
jgi:hypothetical protein